jgi:glycolate oxidase
MNKGVDLVKLLAEVTGEDRVLSGDAVPDSYGHDEALTARSHKPLALVRPRCTEEVRSILSLANEHHFGVTARGSGTGLSGAAIPSPEGVLVSFELMDRVLEVDTVNHVAVVQPGVTLAALDEAAAAQSLVYQVFPGESSASLGGNIATNAGGMRAVKYGVTRHQVLALEAVLATGEVIRTGGRYVKNSTGYDLTQLIVGSEGTLALVTEMTLKLHPRMAHAATMLAPFGSLETVTAAVPRIIGHGTAPLILEYVDMLTMAAITANVGLDLGVPKGVQESALAYLLVVLENARADRLEEDVHALGELLVQLGAIEAFVLPPQAAAQLIEAREKAFFVARALGANDIVDVVVPRAAVPTYMARVGTIAHEHGALVNGCGHVGDGNVHLSVFEADEERRSALLRALFAAGIELGGAISGEHGIGTEKKQYFFEFEDPVKISLMRRIKHAFDPNGILGPGVIFDEIDDRPPGRVTR